MSRLKPIPAIVAGPLYVDLLTASSPMPTGDHHTEFYPGTAILPDGASGQPTWNSIRQVGGSAKKIARYWADHKGDVVFVARIQSPRLLDDPGKLFKKYAFLDDGQWLCDALQRELRDDPPKHKFIPALVQASDACWTDYAFHVQEPNPQNQIWPIFSFGQGAASELGWRDLIRAWGQHKTSVANPEDVIVILGGVLRTKLIPSRSAHGRHELNSRPLYVDFGRTDLRQRSEETEVGKKSRRHTKTLEFIRECTSALLDYSTANELQILHYPQYIPRKGLVVRPHGVRPGRWWRFKQKNAGGPILREEFDAPKPNSGHDTGPGPAKVPDPDQVRRPVRAAELIWRIHQTESPDGFTEGVPYATWENATDPHDITTSPSLLKKLEALLLRVKRDSQFKRLLIYGETGTGKEVVARWIHRASKARCTGPFIALSCARLEGNLVDSALFGHVKGAFTGAVKRDGAFVLAHKGVLVIDDLDALPLTTQAMLLRVLENGEITPLGSSWPSATVDVLVIATTNVAPDALVRQGNLRQDLYYRLTSTPQLEIPALRKRCEDAVRASKTLWERLNFVWGEQLTFPASLVEWLARARIPGNYRTVESATGFAHEWFRGSPSEDSSGLVDALESLDLGMIQSDECPPSGLYPAHGHTSEDGGREFRSARGPVTRKRADQNGEPPALSPIGNRLLERVQASQRGVLATDEARLAYFIECWAHETRETGATYLTRKEIMRILGRSDALKAHAQQKLLHDQATSDTYPRIKVAQHGRNAKWTIVVSPKLGESW